MQQEVSQQLQSVLPPFKRSRTAYEAYSTLRTQDCDEVKLWNMEVRDAQVRVLLRLKQMCCICIKPKASLCASKSCPCFVVLLQLKSVCNSRQICIDLSVYVVRFHVVLSTLKTSWAHACPIEGCCQMCGICSSCWQIPNFCRLKLSNSLLFA